jgi:glycosyltransferase XagB
MHTGSSGVSSRSAREADDRRPLDDQIAPFFHQLDLPPRQLRWAFERARHLRCPLDRVLIRHGLVDEPNFYRRLARTLGARYVNRPPGAPITGQHREAMATGIARVGLETEGQQALLIAPEGEALERLVRSFTVWSNSGSQLLVTTPRVFRAWMLSRHGDAFAFDASQRLGALMPTMTARQGATWPQALVATAVVLMLPCVLYAYPVDAIRSIGLLLGPLFAVASLTRIASAGAGRPKPSSGRRANALRDDRLLPCYGVLVGLYREAHIVPNLVRALLALDYPVEKLFINIILEADDVATRDALLAQELPPWFEVLVAPPGEPRTKPRALNLALPLLPEGLVTVYDAEDRPDPAQLRLAAAAFATAPETLACVQARLVVSNGEDHWLTRCFTLEYAALFGRVIPGLARLGLPVCLGGSSNHFRLAALIASGGWDAWNMTEDADLGVRLARLGFQVGAIDSDTIEEAPNLPGAWMKQRARWLKGWMQTNLTHTRKPRSIVRQLGWAKAAVALPSMMAMVLAPLCYPILTAITLRGLFDGSLLRPNTASDIAASVDALVVIVLGAMAAVAPVVLATQDRGTPASFAAVALLPFYYVYVSAAAWVALKELIHRPFQWNKTEHGQALMPLSLDARASLRDFSGGTDAPRRRQPRFVR